MDCWRLLYLDTYLPFRCKTYCHRTSKCATNRQPIALLQCPSVSYKGISRGLSLLSVRKPSESESIFFMMDRSLFCCSSWSSLTYSSTSSFGGGTHKRTKRYQLRHNGRDPGRSGRPGRGSWGDPRLLSPPRPCPGWGGPGGPGLRRPSSRAPARPHCRRPQAPPPPLCPDKAWPGPAHLAAQQRLAVVVGAVLARRAVQLLGLAGAGRRGAQQQQQQKQQPRRRRPGARPHRAAAAEARDTRERSRRGRGAP